MNNDFFLNQQQDPPEDPEDPDYGDAFDIDHLSR